MSDDTLLARGSLGDFIGHVTFEDRARYVLTASTTRNNTGWPDWFFRYTQPITLPFRGSLGALRGGSATIYGLNPVAVFPAPGRFVLGADGQLVEITSDYRGTFEDFAVTAATIPVIDPTAGDPVGGFVLAETTPPTAQGDSASAWSRHQRVLYPPKTARYAVPHIRLGINANSLMEESFEAGIGAWAFNTYAGARDNGTSLAASSVRATAGTKSLLATWSTTVKGNFATSTITTVVGNTYTMSADVYVPSGSPDVRLTAAFVSNGPMISTKDAWVHTSVTWKATGTTSFPGIECLSATNGQVAYLDTVKIVEGTGTNPFWGGRSAYLDAFQTEVLPLNKSLSPTTFVPPRQIKVRVKPTRLNLSINPSFEITTGNLIKSTGITAVQDPAQAWREGQSLKVSVPSTATAPVSITEQQDIEVMEGDPFTVSLRSYVPALLNGSYRIKVVFTTEAGATVSTVLSDDAIHLASGAEWDVQHLSTVVPALATKANVSTIYAATSPASGTDVFWIDGVLIEKSREVGEYFDGNSGDDYLWRQGFSAGGTWSYYYEDRVKRHYILERTLRENVPLGITITDPEYADGLLDVIRYGYSQYGAGPYGG